jgi:hypothetical protein
MVGPLPTVIERPAASIGWNLRRTITTQTKIMASVVCPIFQA